MSNSLWPNGLHQASLSITNFWSLLKLMFIELVMPSYCPILCCPLLLLPLIFPIIRVFSNKSVLRIRLLQLQLQHQPFQRIFRTDFLQDWLVWTPCSPRDSQESSPTPQFKSLNSSALGFLYGPAFTPTHDYWKKTNTYPILDLFHELQPWKSNHLFDISFWVFQRHLRMLCFNHNILISLPTITPILLFTSFCYISENAAVAAKSLQSCLTLCNPIDSSPPDSSVPGILQARTLEWVAISFSNAWKWKVKVRSLSCVRLFANPRTAAYQAPPSVGVLRQEYWSGLPLPSPSQITCHSLRICHLTQVRNLKVIFGFLFFYFPSQYPPLCFNLQIVFLFVL